MKLRDYDSLNDKLKKAITEGRRKADRDRNYTYRSFIKDMLYDLHFPGPAVENLTEQTAQVRPDLIDQSAYHVMEELGE